MNTGRLKRRLLDFLKFFGLGFGVQIVFLFLFVFSGFVFDLRNPGRTASAILDAYLWPLLVLPRSGGSHGGELFFMPFTAVFYSLMFAFVLLVFKEIGSPRQ